jgi:hypothetical protein
VGRRTAVDLVVVVFEMLVVMPMPVVMEGELGGRRRREVDEVVCVEEDEAAPTGRVPAAWLEAEVGRSNSDAAV